jgi:hypothetical protein
VRERLTTRVTPARARKRLPRPRRFTGSNKVIHHPGRRAPPTPAYHLFPGQPALHVSIIRQRLSSTMRKRSPSRRTAARGAEEFCGQPEPSPIQTTLTSYRSSSSATGATYP